MAALCVPDVSAWFHFSGFPVSCNVDDPTSRGLQLYLCHAREADRVMRGERQKMSGRRRTATRKAGIQKNPRNKRVQRFSSLADRSLRGSQLFVPWLPLIRLKMVFRMVKEVSWLSLS